MTVEMYESKQRLGSEDAPDSPPRYTAAAPVKPCVPFLRMSGTQHQPTEKRRVEALVTEVTQGSNSAKYPTRV